MKNEWIKFCIRMMKTPADEYSGARKIISNITHTMTELTDDLTLKDVGYTKSKMSMLRRLYLVEDSRDAVVPLWEKRVQQRKYGSVSFTCHGHTTKSDPTKGSKRASVMTPCIQSMSLTYYSDHTVTAHAFYRTTEIFKKFPADLVFIRDELLPPFYSPGCGPDRLTFFFANVTVHPMYFATLAPNLDDPVQSLEDIETVDHKFWEWCVKWTARYLIPEYHRGIQKYSQGMSVYHKFCELIDPEIKEELTEYVGDCHPGMKTEYKGEE